MVRRLQDLGYEVEHQHFFDTISVPTELAREIDERAQELGYLLRVTPDGVGLSFDETTTAARFELSAACICRGGGSGRS